MDDWLICGGTFEHIKLGLQLSPGLYSGNDENFSLKFTCCSTLKKCSSNQDRNLTSKNLIQTDPIEIMHDQWCFFNNKKDMKYKTDKERKRLQLGYYRRARWAWQKIFGLYYKLEFAGFFFLKSNDATQILRLLSAMKQGGKFSVLDRFLLISRSIWHADQTDPNICAYKLSQPRE